MLFPRGKPDERLSPGEGLVPDRQRQARPGQPAKGSAHPCVVPKGGVMAPFREEEAKTQRVTVPAPGTQLSVVDLYLNPEIMLCLNDDRGRG